MAQSILILFQGAPLVKYEAKYPLKGSPIVTANALAQLASRIQEFIVITTKEEVVSIEDPVTRMEKIKELAGVGEGTKNPKSDTRDETDDYKPGDIRSPSRLSKNDLNVYEGEAEKNS